MARDFDDEVLSDSELDMTFKSERADLADPKQLAMSWTAAGAVNSGLRPCSRCGYISTDEQESGIRVPEKETSHENREPNAATTQEKGTVTQFFYTHCIHSVQNGKKKEANKRPPNSLEGYGFGTPKKQKPDDDDDEDDDAPAAPSVLQRLGLREGQKPLLFDAGLIQDRIAVQKFEFGYVITVLYPIRGFWCSDGKFQAMSARFIEHIRSYYHLNMNKEKNKVTVLCFCDICAMYVGNQTAVQAHFRKEHANRRIDDGVDLGEVCKVIRKPDDDLWSSDTSSCSVPRLISRRNLIFNLSDRIGPEDSTVYKGTFKQYIPVAVKVVKNTELNKFPFSLDDLKFMMKFRHENFVRYYEYVSYLEETYIASDLAQQNLVDYIKSAEHTQQALIALMKGLCSGFASLHNEDTQFQRITRKITPSNVLISFPKWNEVTGTVTSRALISDYGLGRRANALDTWVVRERPAGWTAAEIWGTSSADTRAADVFGIGCLLFYAFSGGKHLFGDDLTDQERQDNILADVRNFSALDARSDIVKISLVAAMTEKAASKRPAMSAVLKHPLFWSLGLEADLILSGRKAEENKEIAEWKSVNKCYLFGRIGWLRCLVPALIDDYCLITEDMRIKFDKSIESLTDYEKNKLEIREEKRVIVTDSLTELSRFTRNQLCHPLRQDVEREIRLEMGSAFRLKQSKTGVEKHADNHLMLMQYIDQLFPGFVYHLFTMHQPEGSKRQDSDQIFFSDFVWPDVSELLTLIDYRAPATKPVEREALQRAEQDVKRAEREKTKPEIEDQPFDNLFSS